MNKRVECKAIVLFIIISPGDDLVLSGNKSLSVPMLTAYVAIWHQTTIRCQPHIEGILPKGPYLPCVSMAGRALLAGYSRYEI